MSVCRITMCNLRLAGGAEARAGCAEFGSDGAERAETGGGDLRVFDAPTRCLTRTNWNRDLLLLILTSV